MSTPKALVRRLIDRDGWSCAWHGKDCDPETLVVQHRANRGMGGRKSLNRLSNLILLDSHTNGLIESHAPTASEALARGIKISSYAEPSEVRIDHATHGLVWLNDDGTFKPVGEGE